MNACGPLLEGSLGAFRAGEVLQWLTHHPGETTVEFRPTGGRRGQDRIAVHVCDGVARALKLDGGAPRLRPPGGRARPLRPAERDRGVSGPRSGALGALLVERGALGVGELRAGLGLQRLLAEKGQPRPLGDILADLGFVDAGLLEQLLREQALMRLADLFQCDAGRFAIYPGPPEPPMLAIGERIDHLLLRVAHAVDQACGRQTRA